MNTIHPQHLLAYTVPPEVIGIVSTMLRLSLPVLLYRTLPPCLAATTTMVVVVFGAGSSGPRITNACLARGKPSRVIGNLNFQYQARSIERRKLWKSAIQFHLKQWTGKLGYRHKPCTAFTVHQRNPTVEPRMLPSFCFIPTARSSLPHM